jgi:AcrR family transcriptional regulator
MSNKEAILQTAINLFNELGTSKVTTNLIAKEVGISPGNLYYHFNDKAHIIREINKLMTSDWDRIDANYLITDKHFEDILKDFIHANFELLWRYRFFSRELITLINSDPVLFDHHTRMINEHFDQQYHIIQGAVETGELSFPDPSFQAIDALTICWIVANQYLNHLEGMGRVVEKSDFTNGANLVFKYLQPYMTRKR